MFCTVNSKFNWENLVYKFDFPQWGSVFIPFVTKLFKHLIKKWFHPDSSFSGIQLFFLNLCPALFGASSQLLPCINTTVSVIKAGFVY